MAVKLANNAVSTLAASITDSATALSIQVADAGKFPVLEEGDWHPATLIDAANNMEIVRVTARAGNVLTIARAQEGTTAKAFTSGARVDLRVTAGVINKGALGLGNVDDTSDATKPISAPQKAALDARVTWIAAGEPLPAENIGPIWHDTYKSVMTWQSFTANGAAYAGYASVEVGIPAYDLVLRPGFLKLNGASFQKTAYVGLWNWARHNGLVVATGTWSAGPYVFQDNGDGTFRIPDVRGEFFRSADDGRGVDGGRTVGSWQANMTASHAHGVNDPGHSHGVNDPGHVHGGVQNSVASTGRSTMTDQPPAVFQRGSTEWSQTGIWLSGSGTGISIQAAGGVETRPRNTALLACIKF
ncbi:hypothetical protein [Agrobacterium radiobacter]|uniref:hypothetical protein n=1 Tax=Agrobacterium radiobacter TaxID=362 RepID=UPI003F87FA30